MHCRIFGGQAKPGKMAAVLRIVTEQVEQVKTVPGFLFVQVLHNGDEMVAVSSWRTEMDVHAYMRSALAQETLARLTPCLVGVPTIKNFVISLDQEGEDTWFGLEGNVHVVPQPSLQSGTKQRKPTVTKGGERIRLARRVKKTSDPAGQGRASALAGCAYVSHVSAWENSSLFWF